MKVFTLASGVVGLLAALSGVLYTTGPGFRTGVNQQVRNWIGWTEAARQADPVGFTMYVEQRMRSDLDAMQSTHADIGGDLVALNDEIRKQEALARDPERLTDEFRDAYRRSLADGGVSVVLHGAAYTIEQIESQVSLLLAEAEGYRASLKRLKQVQQQAVAKRESLTVRINTTRSQLAALPLQRGVLKAKVLSNEGEQLVAAMDQLFDENRQVLSGDPVRSVVELLAASETVDKPSSKLQSARDFLAAKP